MLSGLLDEARIRELLASVVTVDSIDEAFICGPAPMMDAAERALLSAGVTPERIHLERFGTPAPTASRSAVAAQASVSEGPTAQVSLIVDGKERRLRVGMKGLSILDAGLASGANLPYACKAGVCCTCRAKVLEGEVCMDRNYTLEPHEIAAGFVLTCQSHPVSEHVTLSYDER
jgi:ring-1,2-phenylacetyl-CoA epoxidase subunit PaaE